MHPDVRPDLSGADLWYDNLSYANLSYTNLSSADLRFATIRDADLSNADFHHTSLGKTIFDNVDLRSVQGLETVKHWAPSSINIDTIYRS